MSDASILATEGVTKTFGRVRVVDELNLRVPPGSVYGFLGPNGAGKTTTIRMLLGLVRPDHGDVTVFGLDLRAHRKEILRKVGALVEEPAIYPRLTGRENLQVLTRLVGIRSSRIDEALRQVELLDAADKIAGHYSQGMKQRLGLAIALLNEPQLLILDEPTNGLDPGGIRDVRELLKRLATESGITVFLSSHLLSEVERVATHLGVIHLGKLLFQGMIEDLRKTRASRVVLRINDPAAALAILDDQMANCKLDGDRTLEMDATEPETIAKANRLLVQAGLQVFGIEQRAHRLEDLFMQLTAKEDR